MEKRPTDLKALFLFKVLSRHGGTMRFIRWSFFNPLGNFFEYKAVPFAGLQFSARLKIRRSRLGKMILKNFNHFVAGFFCPKSSFSFSAFLALNHRASTMHKDTT